jgi:lipopolysaccharide export system protein LptA
MTAMHQALSRALGMALIAAACVVLPAAASAQTGLQSLGKNNKGPINIQSDSLELRDKDKTATFINNVRLTQDDTILECRTLVVFYQDDPAKGKGTRSAGPSVPQSGDQQISRMEAKGGVVLTQKDQTATGDHGVYDVKANTFTLVGNVVLTQGPNVIKGDRLLVDMNTNTSRIQSDKSAPVQSLFTPNSTESKPQPRPAPAPHSASQPTSSVPRNTRNASSDKEKPRAPARITPKVN